MCVICVKPATKTLPDEELFRDMWDANPHGAGVMWKSDGIVRFEKGFMSFGEFMRFIRKHRKDLENTECAFHFRITTHGGTNRENTHPFVVHGTGKNLQPGRQRGCGASILMHNGMLPVTPRRETISDTAEFALRIREFNCDACDAIRILGSIDGNRLLVFTATDTAMSGDWKEWGGYHFSNLNFISPTWKPVGGYGSYNHLHDYNYNYFNYNNESYDIQSTQWWDDILGWQDDEFGSIDIEEVEYDRLADQRSRKEYKMQWTSLVEYKKEDDANFLN